MFKQNSSLIKRSARTNDSVAEVAFCAASISVIYRAVTCEADNRCSNLTMPEQEPAKNIATQDWLV
jgi:hypothetical protein